MGLGKLFKNYYNIFNVFGTHLLSESDEVLGYCVFELIDIDIGLCSDRVLKCLLGEGIIDEPIMKKSQALVKGFRGLNGSCLWNIEAVRTSHIWMELLQLSDNIKFLIENRWTYDEIQAISEFDQQIDLESS